MLVLTRKRNESIRIGEIIVNVVEIRGDKVRLGIEADRNVPVHREEVYQAIQTQRPIQIGLEQVADLGQLVIDPLGVADA